MDEYIGSESDSKKAVASLVISDTYYQLLSTISKAGPVWLLYVFAFPFRLQPRKNDNSLQMTGVMHQMLIITA